MKKELVAAALILLAFSTGMLLTAATSGCDSQQQGTAQIPKLSSLAESEQQAQ